MQIESTSLFIVDVSSLIFRAFYAIPQLSTKQGHPTNATYGFLSMTLKLLEKYRPEGILFVYDSKSPSFRKEIYPEYKANRSAPPELLIPQFDDIRRAISSIGLCGLELPGFEADDLIASVVKKFSNKKIVIVSGDKDLMQLVTESVSLLDTMKDKVYGPNEVHEKMGVPPHLIADFLGLVGDSSDNIPGVPGIGPKTAADLLNEFGTLEDVLVSAANLKGKKKEVLSTHAGDARLSKILATLKTEIDDDFINNLSMNQMKIPSVFPPDFKKFLENLELHSLANKIGFSSEIKIEVATSGPKKKIIQSQVDWENCIRILGQAGCIAFDTETRGEKTRDLEIVGLSLCGDIDTAYYIPLKHDSGVQLDSLAVISDFLQLALIRPIVAHNLKYDLKVLFSEVRESNSLNKTLRQGFFNKNSNVDTLIAHYLLDSEQKHSLEFLAETYVNVPKGDFKSLVEGKSNFSEVSIQDGAQYAAQDAWLTFKLKCIFDPMLQQANQMDLFRRIEMPLVPILAKMEWDGFAIDVDVLKSLSEEYAKEMQKLETDIYAASGAEFNLNSPKQLSEILFVRLGLPVIRKTKTGFSTDVEVLDRLAPLHQVPQLIVRYRELAKLKSTYVDVLPSLIESDGRVHGQFNQALTSTGRLSSSHPNLQNIPVKTESGRKIRGAFVASPGNLLVGADYSQVELRILAHLSQDPALVKAFKENRDVHQMTAAEIFHIDESQVTSEQRSVAKAINFGLVYGKTPFGLSQELNISRSQAQEYIDSYFSRYIGVKHYMENCLVQARQDGFVQTIFGRKRSLPDINSRNVAVRNNAERMAMNMPVQGAAADIMKRAMILVDLESEKYGAILVSQVHDELIYDVPAQYADEFLKLLKLKMESAVELAVPLIVQGSSSSNWMGI